MRGLYFGVLVALTLFAGCDKNPLGTVDQRGNAPAVTDFTVSPTGARLDTIPPASNGLATVSAVVSARVSDPDGAGDIAAVTVQALSPAGDAVSSATLLDNGVAPDAAAGDGVYTGVIQMGLARSDIGTYRIVYSASDRENLTGTTAIRSFLVFRHPSPPWLFNLSAPDSVTFPADGEPEIFRMSVAVGDSDGLADIRDVTLRVLGSSNPNAILHLADDGSSASDDPVAGDGIYSIGLRVDATSVKRLYTMAFQAIDKAGDTSATLLHPFLIK